MTNRRALIAAVFGSLAAAFLAALPPGEKSLEVTYYFLPG